MAVQGIKNLAITLGTKTFRKVEPQYEAALKSMAADTFNAVQKQLKSATENTGIVVKLKAKTLSWGPNDYFSIRFFDKLGIKQKVKIQRKSDQTVSQFIQHVAKEAEAIKKLVKDHGQDASIAHSRKPSSYLEFFEGQQPVQKQARALLGDNMPEGTTYKLTRGSFWSGHKKKFTAFDKDGRQLFQDAKPQHGLPDAFLRETPDKVVTHYEGVINPQKQYTYRQVKNEYDTVLKPQVEAPMKAQIDEATKLRKVWQDAIEKSKSKAFEPAYEDPTGETFKRLKKEAGKEAEKAQEKLTQYDDEFRQVFEPWSKKATTSPSARKAEGMHLNAELHQQNRSEWVATTQKKYQKAFNQNMKAQEAQFKQGQKAVEVLSETENEEIEQIKRFLKERQEKLAERQKRVLKSSPQINDSVTKIQAATRGHLTRKYEVPLLQQRKAVWQEMDNLHGQYRKVTKRMKDIEGLWEQGQAAVKQRQELKDEFNALSRVKNAKNAKRIQEIEDIYDDVKEQAIAFEQQKQALKAEFTKLEKRQGNLIKQVNQAEERVKFFDGMLAEPGSIPKKQRAATQIQSAFRGNVVRKQVEASLAQCRAIQLELDDLRTSFDRVQERMKKCRGAYQQINEQLRQARRGSDAYNRLMQDKLGLEQDWPRLQQLEKELRAQHTDAVRQQQEIRDWVATNVRPPVSSVK